MPAPFRQWYFVWRVANLAEVAMAVSLLLIKKNFAIIESGEQFLNIYFLNVVKKKNICLEIVKSSIKNFFCEYILKFLSYYDIQNYLSFS